MLTLGAIKEATAAQAGLTARALIGASRIKAVARPRQRAMYLCRRLRPDCSFPMIGREFANRDHTTVRYAVEAMEARLADDPEERAQLAAVLDVLAPEGDVRRQLLRVAFEIGALEERIVRLRTLQRALRHLHTRRQP